jgi:hypothetical protein
MHNELRRSLKTLNSQTFGYWMEKSYSSLWRWQASPDCGPIEKQQEAKESCRPMPGPAVPRAAAPAPHPAVATLAPMEATPAVPAPRPVAATPAPRDALI